MTISHFANNQCVRSSTTTVFVHPDSELSKELQDKLKSLQPPESVVIRVTKN
jgi:hypothetical protein